MGTLKGEMLQGGCFADEHDARTEIFDFIEAYYNLLPRLPHPGQIRGQFKHHKLTKIWSKNPLHLS